ncbi:MAG: flagellar basal body-associated FliL family protein [Firmicutes bacterium]|nr:flagellar basal body-associated FliL family protein [Bacillota bacterium]
MPEERAVRERAEKGKRERKAAGPPGRRKRLLLLVALLLVLGGAGAATYLLLGHQIPMAGQGERNPPASGSQKLAHKDLKDFTVNLADADANRYLRVNIVVEYGENKELEQELERRQTVIRDEILAFLRTKTVASIRDPAGTEKLKGDLVEIVNRHLEKGRVQRVYFTEFLIQ